MREPRDPVPDTTLPSPFLLEGEIPNYTNTVDYQYIGLLGQSVPHYKYHLRNSYYGTMHPWALCYERSFQQTAASMTRYFQTVFSELFHEADAMKQLSDAQTLVSMHPDMFTISPWDSIALDPALDYCEAENVPVMSVDRGFDRMPGDPDAPEELLVFIYGTDQVLLGGLLSLTIIEHLTEKHGEPIGHGAEFTGNFAATPAMGRDQGGRLVFEDYPDIRIVAVRDCEWNQDISYATTRDMLEVWPENYIDFMIGSNDTICLGAIQAMDEVGRSDIMQFGMDGQVDALEYILDRPEVYYSSPENSPWYGYVTWEYAIRWMNGEFDAEDVPYQVIGWPPRIWRRPKSQEEEDWMQACIDWCRATASGIPSLELGGWEYAAPLNAQIRDTVYQTPWYQPNSEAETIDMYQEMTPLDPWPT
jgi:ribose transport system substrate-binding protein